MKEATPMADHIGSFLSDDGGDCAISSLGQRIRKGGRSVATCAGAAQKRERLMPS